MPKPDHSRDEKPKGEPQDQPAVPKAQGPRFDELMMLVFSGPVRFDDPEETEDKPDAEAKNHEQQ